MVCSSIECYISHGGRRREGTCWTSHRELHRLTGISSALAAHSPSVSHKCQHRAVHIYSQLSVLPNQFRVKLNDINPWLMFVESISHKMRITSHLTAPHTSHLPSGISSDNQHGQDLAEYTTSTFLPFQRLPDVTGKKMFVSGPFFSGHRLLI